MQVIWTDEPAPIFFRLYDPEETDRLFRPLAERIFGNIAQGPAFHARDPKRPTFLDPSWRVFPVHGTYRTLAWTIDPNKPEECEFILFGGEEELTLPFNLTPGQIDAADNALQDYYAWRHAGSEPLAPIFRRMAEDGVDELIQLNRPGIGPYAGRLAAATCCPMHAVLTRSRVLDDWLDDQFRYLFDPTGRWGLFSHPDAFCLVGGEPAFIDPVIEELGGLSAIRGWFIEGERRVDDGENAYSFGLKNVFDHIDWEYPPGVVFRTGFEKYEREK